MRSKNDGKVGCGMCQCRCNTDLGQNLPGLQLCIAPSQYLGVILEKFPANKYRYVVKPCSSRSLDSVRDTLP